MILIESQRSAVSWVSSTVRIHVHSRENTVNTDLGPGTVTIFQYGAGTAGVFRTLGKYMGASGGMFA